MREVKHGGILIARIIPASDWPSGLSFYSADEEFIQVGKWNYDDGKELLAHKHNSVPRTVTCTQEVVYVKKGLVRARLYDSHGTLIESVELGAGDTIVLLSGGHGYDILEDGTQVLEVKNGPYPGADKDRTRF